MPRLNRKSLLMLLGIFLSSWFFLKYLLPLAAPFLLGALLALAAEPVVRLLSRWIPRSGAAALGVTAALGLLSCAVVLLTALAVRELGLLAGALPDLGQAAKTGLNSLEGFLLDLTERTPEGVRPMLGQMVGKLFNGGTAVMDQLTQRLPSLASAVLGWIPGSALTLGTGILSAFMLSARLPRLRRWLRVRMEGSPLSRVLPVLRNMKTAIGGWLKAQLRLAGLCFAIVCTGFWILGIPYAPIWAVFTALVDAIPVLGTGTVLIPWSLVCFLQGHHPQAIGLLAIYAVALLSRTVLEPRLVGKQLGLDPLITLAALYAGYRLWGIGGMLLSPLLCVSALEAAKAGKDLP